MEIAVTVGMAKPNACGHAITVTVTIVVKAKTRFAQLNIFLELIIESAMLQL